MPKILYVGFGLSPFVRGGAVVYQEALAEAVSARGWQTSYLFSLPRGTYTITNRPYLKRGQSGAVKLIELCNAQNYPGCFNPPQRQCRDKKIEQLTAKVLEEERPDIVHFHELKMHAASLIDVVCDRGIPCLKTMHNYYDVCPQGDLMHQGQEACLDFMAGARCFECLKVLPKRESSLGKRIASALLPSSVYQPLADLYKRTIGRKIDLGMPEAGAREGYAEEYCKRLAFFVERLNKLGAIHCSSARSAEIFCRFGVAKDKIRVIPLSMKTVGEISPKLLRDSRSPVVFGYIGGRYPHKGYRVLIDAFARLDQKKAKLVVWNARSPEKLDPGLNVEFRGFYALKDINKVFEEIDVGVMPSLWEEMFGLIGIEWLAARIPVIASNIGGIPEWLKDGENGFLVPPGHAEELAKKMALFVHDPGMVAGLQQRIQPVKRFSTHVDEIEGLYKEIIASKKGR